MKIPQLAVAVNGYQVIGVVIAITAMFAYVVLLLMFLEGRKRVTKQVLKEALNVFVVLFLVVAIFTSMGFGIYLIVEG